MATKIHSKYFIQEKKWDRYQLTVGELKIKMESELESTLSAVTLTSSFERTKKLKESQNKLLTTANSDESGHFRITPATRCKASHL